MKFFRLEDSSRPAPAEAFSGLGGQYAAGRWNTLGGKVVYTSQSLALASLEKLVHAHSLRALSSLNYFEIEIPEAAIERAQDLPADWGHDPISRSSQAYGDIWRKERRSVALMVPSAIIQIEYNGVLNPEHPDFKLSWVRGPFPFTYDPRITAVYRAAISGRRR